MMQIAKLISLVFAFGTLAFYVGIGALPTDTIQLVTYALGWLFGLVLLFLDELRMLQIIEDRLFPADDDESRDQLVTRSLIFMLMLVPTGIYVVTSSGSLLGLACVLGLATTLVSEMTLLRKDYDAFRKRFLSQLKHDTLPDGMITHLVMVGWVVVGSFILFTIL